MPSERDPLLSANSNYKIDIWKSIINILLSLIFFFIALHCEHNINLNENQDAQKLEDNGFIHWVFKVIAINQGIGIVMSFIMLLIFKYELFESENIPALIFMMVTWIAHAFCALFSFVSIS